MKGYRTVIFNGVIGTLGILETADYSFLPDEIKGPLLIGVAIGGLWLRLLTTSPMGKN
jgi:hypothetical protein